MIDVPLVLGLLAALMLVTSFVSGIFGMAGGMILMGALLPLLPVPAAMVLHAVSQMSSNSWRAALWVRYVEWWIFGRYVLGLLAAVACFAWIQIIPDQATVLIALGILPFIAIAIPDRLAPRADRAGGAELGGVIGTGLQLICGVSGPVLDVFFVRTMMDRRSVVATKAACQVVTHLTKLFYFGSLMDDTGYVSWPVIAIAVVTAIIGTSASRIVLERMTDVQFRKWTKILVMGIGAVYIAQGAMLYLRDKKEPSAKGPPYALRAMQMQYLHKLSSTGRQASQGSLPRRTLACRLS
jgi:uncharacterized membrane protein YfcA